MTPRLLVGKIGPAQDLTVGLERAGHSVIALDPADPGAIAHVDLVLIDAADPATVRAWATRFAPHARAEQMFIHTALLGGAQLLDEVETARAIVMCAHQISPATWVTSAADEMGEAVVAMLLAEAGATAVPIADAVRPTLAAAQELRARQHAVLTDAHALTTQAIPNLPAPEGLEEAEPLGVATLEKLYAAIEDPGVRRLFVDLQRRTAEQAGDTAVQVWAMEKYEGRQSR